MNGSGRLQADYWYFSHLPPPGGPITPCKETPIPLHWGSDWSALSYTHLYSLMGAVLQAQGPRGIDRSSVGPQAQQLGLL